MERVFALAVVVLMLPGCSGKGPQVASTVGIAAALKTAQWVQEKRRAARGESHECTIFCGQNDVPCGDRCLPQGALCYEAPRRACYGGDPNGPEEPPVPTQQDGVRTEPGVYIFAPVGS